MTFFILSSEFYLIFVWLSIRKPSFDYIIIILGAWIGAGATILPGICVGAHSIVGASSVVTKDVPDCAVVVGNPARVVKMLDAEKFR